MTDQQWNPHRRESGQHVGIRRLRPKLERYLARRIRAALPRQRETMPEHPAQRAGRVQRRRECHRRRLFLRWSVSANDADCGRSEPSDLRAVQRVFEVSGLKASLLLSAALLCAACASTRPHLQQTTITADTVAVREFSDLNGTTAKLGEQVATWIVQWLQVARAIRGTDHPPRGEPRRSTLSDRRRRRRGEGRIARDVRCARPHDGCAE